uniref:Xylanase inhibitor C-terminal domain-containing protein n=1 Tax=Brassica oleracea var. oleracea TaxID=109376 RepID=A0A0D3EHP3_BRAOL
LKLFTTSVFLGKTGTVISRLPPKVYAALRSAFKKAKMSLHKNTSAVSILDMCFDLTGFKTVTIPTVSFYFSGGAILELSIPTSKLKADVPYNHSDNEEMMHPALEFWFCLLFYHQFKPLKCDFQPHKEDKIKVHYQKHHLHVLNLPSRRPKAKRGLTLKETQQMEFFSQAVDETLLFITFSLTALGSQE